MIDCFWFDTIVQLTLPWHERDTPVAARLTWIGWDECAVEPKNRQVPVDGNHFLMAVTRVKEYEEWCK